MRRSRADSTLPTTRREAVVAMMVKQNFQIRWEGRGINFSLRTLRAVREEEEEKGGGKG